MRSLTGAVLILAAVTAAQLHGGHLWWDVVVLWLMGLAYFVADWRRWFTRRFPDYGNL